MLDRERLEDHAMGVIIVEVIQLEQQVTSKSAAIHCANNGSGESVSINCEAVMSEDGSGILRFFPTALMTLFMFSMRSVGVYWTIQSADTLLSS